MDGKPLRVLVTGDVVIDHDIYRGAARPGKGTSGARIITRRGGAAGIFRLLQQLGRIPAEGRLEVAFGPAGESLGRLPGRFHEYMLWSPRPSKEGTADLWMPAESLGAGSSPPDNGVPFGCAGDIAADVLVLEDRGLGFRHGPSAAAWPGAIRDVLQESDAGWVEARERPATKGHLERLRWVVLASSGPFGQGDLWRAVAGHFGDRTILLTTIDEIRRGEVFVSRGISWERTALELVTELNGNPALEALRKVRHVVITLGLEGALIVSQGDDADRTYDLIFDPARSEGDRGGWMAGGTGRDVLSCLTAAVVHGLAAATDDPELRDSVIAGLGAMRKFCDLGHGPVGAGSPGLLVADLADAIRSSHKDFAAVRVPRMLGDDVAAAARWTIISATSVSSRDAHRPLYGLGRRVALLGPNVIRNAPVARFGKLLTVDRAETESLRRLRSAMLAYVRNDPGRKPLSVAVFGPPGSGKSFNIKQITKSFSESKMPDIEFNLSQFSGPEELIGAFHQVRDKVLEGGTPIVFWDEFDSREYEWLQYLLAPMQDGKFQDGQITHPIGKCVFVFAGGTSYDFENFGPRADDDAGQRVFRLRKGPDFVSRLSGYLNVLGPNRRQRMDAGGGKWVDDPGDVCFPIRRALLMRAILGLGSTERLNMDRGVLSALLETGRYAHGARSLETIVTGMLHSATGNGLLRSNLPPVESISLHADHDEFMRIINREFAFHPVSDRLAPAIHGYYCDTVRTPSELTPWVMEFEKLPEAMKQDNRAAAARIPYVLGLVGLYVVENGGETDPEAVEIIEQNIELLAEEEHEGWRAQRSQNGWLEGARSDENLRHPAMGDYAALPDSQKFKDRAAVRAFPKILALAGFGITAEKP